jgi:hypothetical protein
MTSMMKSNGYLMAFFERPIAAVLGVLTLLAWTWIVVNMFRRPAEVPAPPTADAV